jgi:S-adenosylmethionine synthetase
MERRWLFTSESVTEGHPDKVADQVSDAVLDAVLEGDSNPAHARVACETLVTTGLVVVAGELRTDTYVDIPKIVRETVKSIGYDRPGAGFDGNTCGVMVAIDEQSPDIAGGVDKSLELRDSSAVDDLDTLGAGDQGMMFGFACTETDVLMPMPVHLAHRLAERLAAVRKSGEVPYLRPDGKTQVTVEYEGHRPVRVGRILISTQHQPDIDRATLLRPDLLEAVIAPVIPPELEWDPADALVNPSGKFELGGPQADAGLTGRKIIVDTYGGMARHGGGAFSGKDATKVDRSAAYAARWVAKTIVAAGLAERAELQVAYAIGVAHPVSFALDTFGTETADPDKVLAAVEDVFDLRPAAIIRDLELRKPVFRPTAAYGHFGRDGFAWEVTDRAEDLRAAAGA